VTQLVFPDHSSSSDVIYLGLVAAAILLMTLAYTFSKHKSSVRAARPEDSVIGGKSASAGGAAELLQTIHDQTMRIRLGETPTLIPTLLGNHGKAIITARADRPSLI